MKRVAANRSNRLVGGGKNQPASTAKNPTRGPLLELRSALDRIDDLIVHAREAYRAEAAGADGTSNGPPSSSATSPTSLSSSGYSKIRGGSTAAETKGGVLGRQQQGSTRRFGFGSVGSRRQQSAKNVTADKKKKTKEGGSKGKEQDVLVSTEADEAAILSQFMAQEVENKRKEVEKAVHGLAVEFDAEAKNRRQNEESLRQGSCAARFMPFHRDDEAELVELLRRTSELVVQGELSASAALSRAERAGSSGNDDGDSEYDKIMTEYDAHQAVFEGFCEREGLQTIVNLTTGAAFREAVSKPGTLKSASQKSDESNSGSGDHSGSGNEASSSMRFGGPSANVAAKAAAGNNGIDEADDQTVLLPPMSIATQAVQSVSIILQNVNRVTSLYFLLSNNRVNDLINLPLQLYRSAEVEAKNFASGVRRRAPLHYPQSESSAEMAELTTHFVSFLKSLAMRMNEETLQFFLSYPETGKKVPSGSSLSEMVESKLTVDTIVASASENDGGKDETISGPVTPAAGDGRTVRDTPVQPGIGEVKFPMYAKALQFCDKDQDSFVRVTAMNICLNTLRIATISDESESEENVDDEDRVPTFKSPDAALHKSAALPYRERVAIARHVCDPRRVESLVSPIFIKLASLCASISESIRSFDELDSRQRECVTKLRSLHVESSNDKNEQSSINWMLDEMEQYETKRQRVNDTFLDLSADLQDELLLLEDLLKVGLTSINEQTIEMMLATFVYPLLMQPLKLFMQRNHLAPTVTEVAGNSSETSSEKCQEHPFEEETNFLYVGVSSSDPDSAPAKTALFLASAVFHTISNKPLLHLILTALFHPLAPEVQGGLIIKAKPDITSSDSRGQTHIRADSDATVNYSFGQTSRDGCGNDESESIADKESACVFVLAPALSNVLQSTVDTTYSAPKTRENPLRRIMLSCLGATEGMSALQSLAFYTVDAAFSCIDEKFTNSIILGVGFKSPVSFVGNYVIETISSLCVGVMAASLSSHDIWNLEFNPFATNVVLTAAIGDEMAHSTASKLVEHRVRQSKSCLSQLPHYIDKIMPSPMKSGSKSSESNDEARFNVIVDQMFFDPHLSKSKSIVESLARAVTDDGMSSSSESKRTQTGRCYVPVAQKSSFDDVCSYVSNIPADLLAAADVAAPVRCGARSAFAHIQLDAFSRFFDSAKSKDAESLSHWYGKLDIDDTGDDEASYDGCSRSHRCMFAPLDDRVASILLDEEKDDSASTSNGNSRHDSHHRPKPGSVVGLVGRAAFPCVCEVSPESAALFTDEGACVIAEGIKWQSLYLVILGKYMILAEPEKGGAGGNGRVVTSCRLACLRAEKDDPPPGENNSPARRLLLSFASIDPRPPGIFTAEPVPFGITSNTIRMSKSKMDLWFEDETAANHAFKVLSGRIMKARSRRGNKIISSMMDDDWHFRASS